jgi:hypothetical protein
MAALNWEENLPKAVAYRWAYTWFIFPLSAQTPIMAFQELFTEASQAAH